MTKRMWNVEIVQRYTYLYRKLTCRYLFFIDAGLLRRLEFLSEYSQIKCSVLDDETTKTLIKLTLSSHFDSYISKLCGKCKYTYKKTVVDVNHYTWLLRFTHGYYAYKLMEESRSKHIWLNIDVGSEIPLYVSKSRRPVES